MKTQRETGFSLIEIMVVMLIIGLSLSMVGLVVNRGGPKDQVYETIEQFMGLANFAGEKAILSGEAMGLVMEPPLWQAGRGQDIDDIGWRYRWYTNSSEGWAALPNLPAVSLPASIDLVIEIDENVWDYEAQLDRTTPLMAYYPTGDITNVYMEISDSRDREFVQHLEIDENGILVWREAPELPEGDADGF